MNDDKMAKEYNIEGGSVLHLVSAPGAGCWLLDRVGVGETGAMAVVQSVVGPALTRDARLG